MKYNRFGNTGMNVSRLAVGAMTFGGAWGTVVDLETAQRITDHAIEHGVNAIDTADTYGDSELLVGKILKANGKRNQVFLSTKVYKHHSHDKHLGRNSRINILGAIDDSLRRLQVDHVDLLMLHHADADTPVDETVMALDSVVKQGKARYVGSSNHYAWQIAYHNAVAARLHAEPLVMAQNGYALVDRTAELELLHLVGKFNLGFMAYSPLGAGLLAKGFDSKNPVPTKGRPTDFKKRVDQTGSDVVYRMLDELQSIAKEQSLALNQLAVLWLLAKPVVSIVLMGGSKPEHFASLLEIADKTLEGAVVERLDKLTEPARYGPYKNQPIAAGPGLARI